MNFEIPLGSTDPGKESEREFSTETEELFTSITDNDRLIDLDSALNTEGFSIDYLKYNLDKEYDDEEAEIMDLVRLELEKLSDEEEDESRIISELVKLCTKFSEL